MQKEKTKAPWSKKRKILTAIGGLLALLMLAYVLLSIWYVLDYQTLPSQDDMKKIQEIREENNIAF